MVENKNINAWTSRAYLKSRIEGRLIAGGRQTVHISTLTTSHSVWMSVEKKTAHGGIEAGFLYRFLIKTDF